MKRVCVVALAVVVALAMAASAHADSRVVAVPGLADARALAAAPDGRVWVAQDAPARLLRWDGRRVRRLSLAAVGRVGEVTGVAAGRDVVYVTAMGAILRLVPSTGATRVWRDGFTAGPSGPRAVTIARDGSAWVMLGDGKVARIVGDSIAFHETRSRGTRGPITTGPDGRIWFGGVLGAIGAIDASGNVQRIDLPDRAFALDILRVGGRAIVASGDASVIELRDGRVVRTRRDVDVRFLARRGDQLLGLRADGNLVHLDRHLRPRTVTRLRIPASADSGPPPVGLVPGPGRGLYTLDDGGLVRFTRRPDRRGIVAHCRMPAGSSGIVGAGGRLVATRSLERQGSQDTHQTWYGCATASQRPVVLHRAVQQFHATQDHLTGWKLAGPFAAASSFSSTSHYGDGTLRLRLFDLAGRGRGREVVLAVSQGGALMSELVEHAVGAGGELLFLTRDQPGPFLRLRVSTAHGGRELARGGAISGLRLSRGIAHWVQDGVAMSAPARPR